MCLLLPVAVCLLHRVAAGGGRATPELGQRRAGGLAFSPLVLDVDEDGAAEQPDDHDDAAAEDQQAAAALLARLLLAHLLGDRARSLSRSFFLATRPPLARVLALVESTERRVRA